MSIRRIGKLSIVGALLGAVGATAIAAPYPVDAPWPVFRGDSKNTGRSTIAGEYNGSNPWFFRTERGIFSTPVIDAEETVYVGSADHTFYALDTDGHIKWSIKTGEIIDSAAALTIENEQRFISIPSGDGHLYHAELPTDNNPEPTIIWSFDASQHRHELDLGFDWFEGNIVAGPDGKIYAGNTNFNYYKLDQHTGELLWRFPTNNMNWSAGAFDDDGNVYWTSLDLHIRKVDPLNQATLWKKFTLGPVTASVALGSDNTAYVGSFDTGFYALDGKTGKQKWRFQTTDHIYGSAALGQENGHTNAIYFTSTDGHLYKLDANGELVWKFDAGDVIRSSVAIGPAPGEEKQDIAYFGAANGWVYAINGNDGSMRWAYDTNQQDPQIADRNDVNASPALGLDGVYIAGEHGYIWHVPYDYPLHHPEDPRSVTDRSLPENIVDVRFGTAGGDTLENNPTQPIASSSVIHSRLVVRQHGETIDAGFRTNPLSGFPAEGLVSIEPFVDFKVEPSADAHVLHFVPKDFMEPDTEYNLHISGETQWDGFRIGGIEIGGKEKGSVSDTVTFNTAPAYNDQLPLTVGVNETSAFEIRRLAVPYPSMMPSLNQIGFDSYTWIASTVKIEEPDNNNEGDIILWVIGAQLDDEGTPIPDKATDFTFPMAGRYKNDSFMVENKNLKVNVSGINIPFNTFQMRGQLLEDMSVLPGATLWAEVSPFNDPVYGPILAASGMLNNNGKVVVGGTYLTQDYPATAAANKRPSGLVVSGVEYKKPTLHSNGHVTVTVDTSSWKAADHITGVLIIDESTGEPLFIDYKENTSEKTDISEMLQSVRLTIPAGTPVPIKPIVVVMADAFPLHQQALTKATFWERLWGAMVTWLRSLIF